MKKLKLPAIYGQRQSPWESEILGYNKANSKYTINLYGCLITSLGNIIGKNPHEVNELLKANGGFTEGSGNFMWSKSTVLGLTQTYISPKYTGLVTAQGIAKIRELIGLGYPLIAEVDFNPATTAEEQHFLVLVGFDHNEITAFDVYSATLVPLNVYGGVARAVIQFRAYNKTLPFESEDTLPVEKAVFEELVRKSSLLDRVSEKLKVTTNEAIVLAEIEKLLTYEDAIRKQSEVITAKDQQIEEVKKEAERLQGRVVELQKQNVQMQDELTKTQNDMATTQKDLTAQSAIVQKQELVLKEVSTQLTELQKVKSADNLSAVEHLAYAIKKLWRR